MYLRRKVQELKAIIAKVISSENDDTVILGNYIEKWEIELRSELGLPIQLGATIGLSCDDTVALTKLPVGIQVREGIYTSHDGRVLVEVMSQDALTGLVQIEFTYPGETEAQLDMMGSKLFNQLFQLIPETVKVDKY